MPDLNLDEIEKRCEKATKEPWRDCKSIHGSKYRYVQIGKDEMYTTLEMKPDDARFIAHARTDIPALVAEVKRLREEHRMLHRVECNHTSQPIGGPGCICVVANKYAEERIADNALEEAAKICELAKCRADYDPVLDGCAEKIRALKTNKGE